MFFKRKKGMIDVGEMHKRGMVISPPKDPNVDKYRMRKDGFVELKETGEPVIPTEQIAVSPEKKSSGGFANFFGFMDSSETTGTDSLSSMPTSSSINSVSTEGYEKREVDEKVEKLDSLIYKLEQRIEVLERKLNLNQGSNW